MALAAREDIEVLGITCVKGNVGLEKTYLNAQRICAAAGRLDIPVLRGIARPMLAPAGVEASVHGVDGLGGIDLPLPNDFPETKTHAVDFIRQQAKKHPGEVVLCAIGPLTNVAVALLMEPELAQSLRSVVFMGGAAYCAGNMNDFAEFNFMVDPHAAEIVLQSGAQLVMFGLDVTQKTQIEEHHLTRLQESENIRSAIVGRLLTAYAKADHHLHDPCVIAWLIEPSMFSGTQSRVSIVTEPGPQFGRSMANIDQQGNCLVVTHVDQQRLFSVLLSNLAQLP